MFLTITTTIDFFTRVYFCSYKNNKSEHIVIDGFGFVVFLYRMGSHFLYFF